MFGHVIGDELLCAIARRLEAAVGSDFIARVGGDEFIIISTAGEQPQIGGDLGRSRAQGGCRALRDPRAENPDRPQHRGRGLSARRQRHDGAARQCRCRALPGQGRRAPDGAVLRSRDGPAPARALRAAARSALGHRPRRARLVLPAASQDRRRGVRLRGAAALAASQARASCPQPSSSRSPSRTA